MIQDLKMYSKFPLLLLLLLNLGPVAAEGPASVAVPANVAVPAAVDLDMHDYDTIASEVFWQKLYPEGGWTLYCGFRFDMQGQSQEGLAIGIDQMYATDWMLDNLHCRNRTECYAKNKQFKKMEADMHNLYPAWSDLLVYRNGRSFGSVPGKDSRFENCEFEWDQKVIEPRDLSKGNIARSILYMHKQYELPITNELLQTLKLWNRQDPPSEQEADRNNKIEQLQGQRNPYIDKPMLVEKIILSPKK